MYRALAETIQLFDAADCNRAEDRTLVDRYLAALAPALADAVLGKDVLGKIAEIERLFGNTWLLDQAPCEPAFSKWREFRDEYGRFIVRGLTVNERLHAFSLSDDYDRAIASGDTEALRKILSAVHVDDASMEKILSNIEDTGE